MAMDELWVLNEKTRANFIAWLSRADVSNELYVRITDKAFRRTDLQNRYLFGWIYPQTALSLGNAGIGIRTEHGRHPWTKGLLHEQFRSEFLVAGEVVARSGRVLKEIKSTTTLSTKEFTELTRQIKEFVSEFWGIEIPEPPGSSVFNAWQRFLKEGNVSE